MKHKEWKLPAQCTMIPPEEQQMLTGGGFAEGWARLKDTLRPYKPYAKLALEVLGPVVNILLQLNVMMDAARELKHGAERIL